MSYVSKGISFPFRVSVKGGATMSSVDINSPQKIVESYQQILMTHEGERCMEFQQYSHIDKLVFSLMGTRDSSLTELCEALVMDALNTLEKRATVNDVVLTELEDTNTLVAIVNFTVKMTEETYNTTLKVGETK